jgi:alpha-L-fucosidase
MRALAQAVTFDIERGGTDSILPQPWETDTCIGQWHYNKSVAGTKRARKSSACSRIS